MRAEEPKPLRGALDVGSNSVKILVASSAAELSTPVYDDVRICGLGQGLAETGCLAQTAMDRSAVALRELIETARAHGVDEIAAVGTMALRSATNGDEFHRVFIHFKSWPNGFDDLRQRLIQNANKKDPANPARPHDNSFFKIIYDDPWFWTIFANFATKHSQTSRPAPKIVL